MLGVLALLLSLALLGIPVYLISRVLRRNMRAEREGRDERERAGLPARSGVSAGAVVFAILVVLWARGTFDRPLSSIGLNSHECGRNAFGATFCGDELKRYRQQVQQP